jgi:hypothetical protein
MKVRTVMVLFEDGIVIIRRQQKSNQLSFDGEIEADQ